MKIGTLILRVKIKFSFLDALKLRIAGLKISKNKITIDELIKEGRP